ncbi:transposase [Streptomyces sp. NPDC020490]|uniref:transposase n=1 Tax=Streptomyces sp. NPDC020490 TaxID=3365078 RepID=UPI0037AFEC01
MKVYSPEFKVDAVVLYHSDPDLTIAQVALELGIRRDTLRRWIDAADTHNGTATRKSTKDDRVSERTKEKLEAENEALRAELKAAWNPVAGRAQVGDGAVRVRVRGGQGCAFRWSGVKSSRRAIP